MPEVTGEVLGAVPARRRPDGERSRARVDGAGGGDWAGDGHGDGDEDGGPAARPSPPPLPRRRCQQPPGHAPRPAWANGAAAPGLPAGDVMAGENPPWPRERRWRRGPAARPGPHHGQAPPHAGALRRARYRGQEQGKRSPGTGPVMPMPMPVPVPPGHDRARRPRVGRHT